ncbi:RNA polymerase sigma factor, partial [Candidatus Hydrogenedentota bacterium]
MTDAEIISKILGGSTDFFAMLVDRYVRMVRGLCGTYVSNQSEHDDLIQESFTYSYQKLDSLRNHNRYGPWLAKITRGACKNWIRSQVRRQRTREAYAAEAITRDVEDGSKTVARKDTYEWIHAQLSGLPDKTRETMVLYYVEGLTTREVASLLGIRESAAKKRLAYGRHLVAEKIRAELSHVSEQVRDTERLKQKVMLALPLSSPGWLGKTGKGSTAAKGSSTAAKAAGTLSLPTIVAGVKMKVALALIVVVMSLSLGVTLVTGKSPYELVRDASFWAAGAGGESGAGAHAGKSWFDTMLGTVFPKAGPLFENGTEDLHLLSGSPNQENVATGSLELTLNYALPGFLQAADARFQAVPVANKRVRLARRKFDAEALREILREADISDGLKAEIEKNWHESFVNNVPFDIEMFVKNRAKDSSTAKSLRRLFGNGIIGTVIKTLPEDDWIETVTSNEGKALIVAMIPGNYVLSVPSAKKPMKNESDPKEDNTFLIRPGECTEYAGTIIDYASAIRGRVVLTKDKLALANEVAKNTMKLILSGEVTRGMKKEIPVEPETGLFEVDPNDIAWGDFRIELAQSAEPSSIDTAIQKASPITGTRIPGVALSALEMGLGKNLSESGEDLPGNDNVTIMASNQRVSARPNLHISSGRNNETRERQDAAEGPEGDESENDEAGEGEGEREGENPAVPDFGEGESEGEGEELEEDETPGPILALDPTPAVLDFGLELIEETFVIYNASALNGPLNWSLDVTGDEANAINVQPTFGISPEVVTVSVDRTDLDGDNYELSLDINSNGGNGSVLVQFEGEPVDSKFKWSRRAGGSASDSGSSVSVFPDGSFVVTGSFSDSATF